MIVASLLIVALAQVPNRAADLAQVAADAPITVTIPNPGLALRQALRGLHEAGSVGLDPSSLDLDEDLVAALAECGVELDDPDSWSRAGIDAAKPVTYSLTDLGGWLGLPQTTWMTFGVSDDVAALRFLRALHGAAEVEKSDGGIEVYATDAEAWCLFGGQAWVLLTSRSDVTVGERLLEVVTTFTASPTLGGDPLFKTVAERVDAEVRGSVWINMAKIRESNPVRAILGVVTDNGIEIGFAPSETAHWFDRLQPGGTARDVMSRFDPPMFAASVSLAEPLQALDGFQADEAIDGELDDVIARVLAIAGGDAAERLASTSMGMLLYPRGDTLDDPRAAICVHVNGVDAVLASARQQAERGELPFELDGEWLRGEVEGKEVVLGAVGDYLAFGDARAEIRRAARTDPGAWAPAVGGRSLFAIEIDALELALSIAEPTEPTAIVALERDGRLVVEVQRGEAGLIVRARFVGDPQGAPFLKRMLRAVGLLAEAF